MMGRRIAVMLTYSKDDDQNSSSSHVDNVGVACKLGNVHFVHNSSNFTKQRLRLNAILTRSGNFSASVLGGKWPPTPIQVVAERCVFNSHARSRRLPLHGVSGRNVLSVIWV